MTRLLWRILSSFVRNHYRALGALPSPLWGGVGGGGSAIPAQVAPSPSHRTTPTPALRADPPHKGEGKMEFAARAVALTASACHHLHLHLHLRRHHRPPHRSRTTEEAAARGWRLKGFHFSGTGSVAAWRGESASGAKSSTATAAATASAAARSSFAS